MISKVIDLLNERNWTYSIGKNSTSIVFSLTAQNGIYHCFAEDRQQLKIFLFISFLGTSCPLKKREEMCKLLTMINSNLLYGNFEMELDNGNIKFRTGIMYQDIEMTNDAISNIISRTVDTIDISHPHLIKFMLSDITIVDVYNSLYPPHSIDNSILPMSNDL